MRMGSALLLIVALGGAYLAGRLTAGHAPDAELLRRADSLAARLRALEEHHLVVLAHDQALQDSLAVAHRRIGALAHRRDTVEHRVDTLVLAVTSEELRDSLTAAIAAERLVAESLTVEHAAAIRLWGERYDAAAAERDRYREVALQLQAQLSQAVAQTQRPGVLGRAVQLLPWVAGAYVVGRITR